MVFYFKYWNIGVFKPIEPNNAPLHTKLTEYQLEKMVFFYPRRQVMGKNHIKSTLCPMAPTPSWETPVVFMGTCLHPLLHPMNPSNLGGNQPPISTGFPFFRSIQPKLFEPVVPEFSQEE
jgi:hypothetical protein